MITEHTSCGTIYAPPSPKYTGVQILHVHYHTTYSVVNRWFYSQSSCVLQQHRLWRSIIRILFSTEFDKQFQHSILRHLNVKLSSLGGSRAEASDAEVFLLLERELVNLLFSSLFSFFKVRHHFPYRTWTVKRRTQVLFNIWRYTHLAYHSSLIVLDASKAFPWGESMLSWSSWARQYLLFEW